MNARRPARAHPDTRADGTYERNQDYLATRITADGRDGYPVGAGRYRLVAARACPWANRARDLFQTPGFGDTIDFVQIKQHYYRTQDDLNPSRIVPVGPDTSGWLVPHHREQLEGRPFGDGTPPEAPAPDEAVTAGHGA